MSKLRKRIKDEDEEHISESWLIPYADILTLLLALFIVLFASSSIDKEKFQGVMESLQNELAGSSTGAKIGTGNKSGVESEKDGIQTDGEKEKNPESEEEKEKEPLATIIDPELDELRKQLEKYLEENNLKSTITLQESKRGIEISLQELVLFDSGSAVIKPESYNTLNGLLGLIRNIENPISFEGHTDNVPIRSSAFPSNWELAAARAASVLHYFEANNISAQRMQFASYGEYKPIFENDTPEHRKVNRRVTIVIMKKG